MGRGKTKSKMSRSQRIERAYELFSRGYSNADVARDLVVHADTVAAYRARFNDSLREAADSDPHVLTDTLKNTHLMLEEGKQVQKNAWRQIDTTREFTAMCQCGCMEEVVVQMPLTDQARASYLNTILKVNEQRAKLYNLLGVKQDVFIQFQTTNLIQKRMLEWMQQNLCATDREALADFYEKELAPLMPALGTGSPAVEDDIYDAEIVA